ncbi:MAG TPA: hypothetical protein ACFYD6_03160 [Candidatus Brocadiia bacterium]|nr:hypothetical protein [Candidatus Brocadiales bacterium]
MNDTSPLIESIFLEMMMRKSGQEFSPEERQKILRKLDYRQNVK